MPTVRQAKFRVYKEGTDFIDFFVQYNPAKLVFGKKPKIAEIPIPGLDTPLKQFIRGESETLTLELFFDTTERGTGNTAESVTLNVDAFYGLVKINPKTHAPPVCAFMWAPKFPGDQLPEMYKNQRRAKFKGVVTDVKQEFTMFGPTGTPLRAKLTVTMSEFKTQHEQIVELDLESPDRTRSYVLERGDTLAAVSWKNLENVNEWRHLANANDIEDPRRLEPGRTLLIPPLR
jgi:hypothetical protein